MASAAFWFAVTTFVACVAVCIPFLATVKNEAPTVYAEWGAPSLLGLVVSRRIWWPFSGMVLSRQYRHALAAYPRSKAWASWLFLAHWLQLIGLMVFVVSLLMWAPNEFHPSAAPDAQQPAQPASTRV